MNHTITFRPYRPADRAALTEIIRRTWNYDRFTSAEIAQRMARLYLDNCLCSQTFTRVAVQDGRAIGIIMAKNRRRHRLMPLRRLRWLTSFAAMTQSAESRAIMHFFGDVSTIDQTLLAESGRSYDGEITFFAIDATARGQGLGRRLFGAARQYLHEQGIQNCYLFTDTSCNYPFYEHLGLTRRAAHSRTLHAGGEAAEMTFFLYDFEP